MADRRLSIEVIADASKFSEEMKVAAKAAQALHDRAESLAKQLDAADAQRASLRKERIDALTKTEKNELSKRLVDANKHIADLKQLYARNEKAAADAEHQITGMVKSENAKRVSLVQAASAKMSEFGKAFAAGIAGGLVAGGGIAIFQELGRAVRGAITGFIEYGHQVEHTARLMGTTTENASLLTYAFQRFGLTSADVDRTVVQLTRHIVTNEKQFGALGVATRDANGNLKSSYDIFQNLRQAMSGAADGTAKTALQLALASRGGSAAGQSFAELNAILSLSDDQWAALQQQAEAAGRILDEKTARAAYDTQQQMRQLGQDIQSLGLQFGEIVMGPIHWFINGLLDIIDTLQALSSVEGSFGDKIGAFFGTGPLAGAVQSQVASAKAARDALAAATNGSGIIPPGALRPSGGGGSNAAAQQQIQDIRAAAKARENALRDALIVFTRERDGAIKAIEAERKGRDQMFAAMTSQLHAAERARSDAHNAEIQRIQDEQRARADAFAIRQRNRDSEVAGIRAEIAAIDRQSQAESDLRNIQNAQKTLDHEKFIEINKSKSETLASYYRRTFHHEQLLATDTQRLSAAKTKKVIDDRKAELNAAIRAIEAVALADRRQTEDAKKNAETRIRAIHREMVEEKKKSDAAIKAIQDQQKNEKIASDAKIQGLRDQLTAEKQRVDDAIKQIQRETDATVKALEKQLRAHQGAAGGMAAAYTSAGKQIAASMDAATASVARLQAAVDKIHGPGGARAATTSGIAPTGGTPGKLSGNMRPGGNIWGPHADLPGWIGNMIGGFLGGAWKAFNTPPHHKFAQGGSMVLTEPTALIGLTSGTYHGIAGEAGTETATFTPGGARRSAQGGVVIHQTIVNPGMPEIETLVRRGTLAAIAEADRIDEVRGYTIR